MTEQFRPGMRVEGSDGQAGRVSDVLLDENGAPRYLVVQDRGIFSHDVVLPVAGASGGGDAVRYDALTRAQIHHGDRYDEARYGAQAGLRSMAASRYDREDEQR